MLIKLFINSWLFLFFLMFLVNFLDIFKKLGWMVLMFVREVKFLLKCLMVIL